MTHARDRADRTMLVTGAAGFIGSALCHLLRTNGHAVVAYDNLSRGRAAHLPEDVRVFEGDIRDRARLEEAIAQAQPWCVIHLAAMHFIPDCIARPRETLEVNVEGTRRVLDCCRAHSVPRVIFASTAAVYAPSDRPCVEETTPLGPLEIYGESKLAGEQLARTFHEDTGTPTAILRFFNAVGRNETNPHLVPHIFESLQKSDVIELGNTAPRRDYIDTRDVARAILAVADQMHGLSVLNVGTGVAFSALDIIESLRRMLRRPITLVQDAARVRTTDRMLLVADVASIRAAAGWAPELTFDETLRDLVAAYGLANEQYLAR